MLPQISESIGQHPRGAQLTRGSQRLLLVTSSLEAPALAGAGADDAEAMSGRLVGASGSEIPRFLGFGAGQVLAGCRFELRQRFAHKCH